MRNLVQYPITAEEVLDQLKWIPDDTDLIGSTGQYIRKKLVEYISNPENMAKILESMRVK